MLFEQGVDTPEVGERNGLPQCLAPVPRTGGEPRGDRGGVQVVAAGRRWGSADEVESGLVFKDLKQLR